MINDMLDSSEATLGRQVGSWEPLNMARKPIELPPEIARAFVRDMNAFFAEKNQIKADTRSRSVFRARRFFLDLVIRGRKIRNTWLITISLAWIVLMSGALWVLIMLY